MRCWSARLLCCLGIGLADDGSTQKRFDRKHFIRGGRQYVYSASYGVGKAGVDRMAEDFAIELRDYNVAALSPSKVKTEFILEMVEQGKMQLDPSVAQSVRFSGRVIAALAADPNVMDKSGGIYTVSELADTYGVIDPDKESP